MYYNLDHIKKKKYIENIQKEISSIQSIPFGRDNKKLSTFQNFQFSKLISTFGFTNGRIMKELNSPIKNKFKATIVNESEIQIQPTTKDWTNEYCPKEYQEFLALRDSERKV